MAVQFRSGMTSPAPKRKDFPSEGKSMITVVRDKFTELWVPKEASNQAVRDASRQLLDAGQYVVVYRSGTHSLADVTAQLLQNNL